MTIPPVPVKPPVPGHAASTGTATGNSRAGDEFNAVFDRHLAAGSERDRGTDERPAERGERRPVHTRRRTDQPAAGGRGEKRSPGSAEARDVRVHRTDPVAGAPVTAAVDGSVTAGGGTSSGVVAAGVPGGMTGSSTDAGGAASAGTGGRGPAGTGVDATVRALAPSGAPTALSAQGVVPTPQGESGSLPQPGLVSAGQRAEVSAVQPGFVSGPMPGSVSAARPDAGKDVDPKGAGPALTAVLGQVTGTEAVSPHTDEGQGPGTGDGSVPAPAGGLELPKARQAHADAGTQTTENGGVDRPTTLPSSGVAGAGPVAGPSAAAAATGAGAVQSPSSQSAAVLGQVLPVVPRLVSRGDGSHRLVLRLHPQDLGEVRLTVTVRGKGVDVTLAAGPAARDALREGTPQLKAVLELAGHTAGELVIRDLPTGSQQPLPSPAAHGGASTHSFTDSGTGRDQQPTPGQGRHETGHDRPSPGRPRHDPSRTAPAGAVPAGATLDLRI